MNTATVRSLEPKSMPDAPTPEALEAALAQACGAKRAILTPDGRDLGEGWLLGAYRRQESAPPELAELDDGAFTVEAAIWCLSGRRWLGILIDRSPSDPEGEVTIAWRSNPGDLLMFLKAAAQGTAAQGVVQDAAGLRLGRLPEDVQNYLEWWIELAR